MAEPASIRARFDREALPAKEAALAFLRQCVRNGLAHSYVTSTGDWVKPYPEVTGYLLSLFAERAEDRELSASMARRLIALQEPSGGYRSFSGEYAYVFDTAQICQGLLDWHRVTKDPAALAVCRRGAEFIRGMQVPGGAFFPLHDGKLEERVSLGTTWGNSFSPINCKCAEFLMQMTTLGIGDYRRVVDDICRWTLQRAQLPDTHPGAYALEGLIAGGHVDDVKSRLQEHFLDRIDASGFIAYHPKLHYSYVSGSVQIAILCARVGWTEPAWRIWNWARAVQLHHASGGLFQYANPDGTLNSDVHVEINSWGAKYYVELIDTLAATRPPAAAPITH